MDYQTYDLRQGWEVYGSDGEKIGEVFSAEQNYFIVEKGWLFKSEHYIPYSAIASTDGEAVYLNVTKDTALDQNWDVLPTSTEYGDEAYSESAVDRDDTTYTRGVPGGTNTEDDRLIGHNDAGYVTRDDSAGVYAEDEVVSGEQPLREGAYTADLHGEGHEAFVDEVDRETFQDNKDHTTIERAEEELYANTREVDRGAVRVNKTVHEEEQSIDVPVHEEEVNVTRHDVDRDAGEYSFREDSIEVPIRGEEVDVEKRARVVEEIDIDKTARDRTETVTDTIRREEVEIDEDGTGYRRDDDRSLLDKAKDALDTDDDGRVGR